MAKYRKLGRTSSQRKALLRSQVTALILNGKIVTTEARAKEVQKQVESLIALAVKEKDSLFFQQSDLIPMLKSLVLYVSLFLDKLMQQLCRLLSLIQFLFLILLLPI